jgi:RNA polymerase sigma factor (sigma-70 family)
LDGCGNIPFEMPEQTLTASEPAHREMDQDLLLRYAAGGPQSEHAFAQLVTRHVALVHSAARRQLRDPHAADDVTQAVFWILARKARALAADPRLLLPAWLWNTARLASLAAARSERRLKRRERTAAQMQAIDSHDAPAESTWDDLGPRLDAALARLREADRRAVILRFLQRLTLREVGASLGVSEDAAKQRISRALGRLRAILSAGGITSPSLASLSALVAENAARAASPALTQQVTFVASSPAAPALAKSTLHALTFARLKPIAAAILLTLAGITTSVLILQAVTGQAPPPAPTVNSAPAARPRTTSPATQPADWQSSFNAAYALAPGQTLKRIPPPPIAARQRLFDQLDRGRKSFDPRAAYLFVWNDKGLQNIRGPLGPHTLQLLLSYGLDIPTYSLDLPDALRTMRLSGDWVVRQGAAEGDKLADLARIVERDWNLKITFTRQMIEREVLVAKGRFKPGDAKRPSTIDLFTNARPTTTDHVEGDLASLLRTAGELVGLIILDENPAENPKVNWRFGKGVLPNTPLGPEDAALLLEHLSDQTGIEFKREIRSVEQWLAREAR